MSRITGNSLVMGGVLMVVSVLLMYCPVFAQTDSLRRKVEAAYLSYDIATMNRLLQEWHQRVPPKSPEELSQADRLMRYCNDIYNAYFEYYLEELPRNLPYVIVQQELYVDEVTFRGKRTRVKHGYQVLDFRPSPRLASPKLLYSSDSCWRACAELYPEHFIDLTLHINVTLKKDTASLLHNFEWKTCMPKIERMNNFLSWDVGRLRKIELIQVDVRKRKAVVFLEDRYMGDCTRLLKIYEMKLLVRRVMGRWKVTKVIRTSRIEKTTSY